MADLTFTLTVIETSNVDCNFSLSVTDGVTTASLTGAARYASPIGDPADAQAALNAVIATSAIEGGRAPLDDYRDLLTANFA